MPYFFISLIIMANPNPSVVFTTGKRAGRNAIVHGSRYTVDKRRNVVGETSLKRLNLRQ